MIGPRCSKCKKQRRYHGGKELWCPVGKRLSGAYFFFHTENRFEAKEPKSRGSAEKRKDYGVRRYVKSQPCSACGHRGSAINPVDPCHLRTWKVTQCDLEVAMIPLCRFHHTQSHVMGWGEFFDLYPKVLELVLSQGWEVSPDPFRKGRVILSHPEVA